MGQNSRLGWFKPWNGKEVESWASFYSQLLISHKVRGKIQQGNVYFCIPTDSTNLGSIGRQSSQWGELTLPQHFVLSGIKQLMKEVSQKLQGEEKRIQRKHWIVLSKA